MSERAGLDIRVPIGGLFGVLGLLLAGYGATTGAQGAWLNVDLWWGIVMIAFSATLLLFSRRRR